DDGLAVDVLRHLGLTSEIANSFGTAARLGHEQVRRHGLLLEEQNLTLGLERTFRYSVGADDPLVLRRGLVARNEVRPPRAQGEQLLLGRLVTIDRPLDDVAPDLRHDVLLIAGELGSVTQHGAVIIRERDHRGERRVGRARPGLGLVGVTAEAVKLPRFSLNYHTHYYPLLLFTRICMAGRPSASPAL